MVPGGEFRHDAAIGLVHRDLAVQAVRQQPQIGVVDRDRGLIARTLNPDYTHIYISRRYAPKSPGATHRNLQALRAESNGVEATPTDRRSLRERGSFPDPLPYPYPRAAFAFYRGAP
jgi:hypothetical protein